MTEIIQPIPARIKNVAIGGHVAGTEDIIDDNLGKTQQTINQEVDNKIEVLTSQDIEVVSALPAVGDADPKKIYRVSGTTSYTDYMLNPAGSAFSQLATFSFPGIDDEPVAGSNNLVKSDGLSTLLYGYVLNDVITSTNIGGYVNNLNKFISVPFDDTHKYGFSYIPVVSGRRYIIKRAGVSVKSVYAVVVFSTTIMQQNDTVTVLSRVSSDSILNDTFEYTPTENGYLYQYNQNVYNGNITFEEYITDEKADILNDKIDHISDNLKNIETKDIIDISDIYDFHGYGVATSNKFIALADNITYGFLKFISVKAGETYILNAVSANIAVATEVMAGFCANYPGAGVSFTSLKTYSAAGTYSFELTYTPEVDGFLFLYSHNILGATRLLFYKEDYTNGFSNTMDKILQNENNINAIKSPLKVVVDDVSEWLGYCGSTNGIFKVSPDTATWGFKYISVEKGKQYIINAEKVSLLYPQYAVIVFSGVIPENNTVGTVLKAVSTGSSSVDYIFEYTADANGYLFVYSQDRSLANITFLVLDYDDGINNTMNRITALENEDDYSKIPPIRKNIICSGSSITWGTNAISGVFDSSMVKYIDKYLKNIYSKTILCDNENVSYSSTPTIINNNLMYNQKGAMIEGVGGKIEFDLYGDEIAICQMKRRSNHYGIMKVTADGNQIGIFDNKNPIITNVEEVFTGASITNIKLSHPCTFNHRIYINGDTDPIDDVVINDNTSSSATIPEDCNAWVIRSLKEGDGSSPIHAIRFNRSRLGTITSVRVVYDYGKIIAHERSTIGQLTDDEYANEIYWGEGGTSYDPARPSPATGVASGIEFRTIDERAFFIYRFTTAKTRHYKIEIIGGENPYFIFNFATNRYHNLMNAGIGGWQLSDLLYYSGGLNNYRLFFNYFIPDIIFEEAMTNDDWEDWGAIRRISRSIGEVTLTELQKMHQLEVNSILYNSSTDKYNVELCTGIIDSITPTSLISSDIINTNTQVGDIIRIGNYHGDMQQITCRRITEVNLSTGEVKWLKPITPYSVSMIDNIQDLVGAEINIRNLDQYKANYVELINKVHGISPSTKLVVVHNGLPNLWTRQLWGYDIIHEELSKEHSNVEFVNAQQHILDAMNQTISGKRHELVTSTGEDTYSLSFAGTQYRGWQGFKVLVDGIDVYGKDAYVEMAMSYRLKNTYSGASVNKTSPYDRTKCDIVTNNVSNFTLHFIKNVPPVGATIEVQFADELWSGDFCHVAELGAQLYAESYKEMIDKL